MPRDKKDALDYISPFTKKYVKPCIDWCVESKFHLFLLVFGIILTFILSSFIKKALIIFLLIFIGGFSNIYQRYIKTQVGVELIMLVTIVSGFVFGPLIGGLVGFTTFALANYIGGKHNRHMWTSYILIFLVGVFASYFNDGLTESVILAGLILTVIYDLFIAYFYIAWFKARLNKVILFVLTHILWNIIVFVKLAPLVVESLI